MDKTLVNKARGKMPRAVWRGSVGDGPQGKICEIDLCGVIGANAQRHEFAGGGKISEEFAELYAKLG
jgi:hypothetical protein